MGVCVDYFHDTEKGGACLTVTSWKYISLFKIYMI